MFAEKIRWKRWVGCSSSEENISYNSRLNCGPRQIEMTSWMHMEKAWYAIHNGAKSFKKSHTSQKAPYIQSVFSLLSLEQKKECKLSME